MPNQTFLNLSPEKQKTILAAAHKEFSTHGLHDASVTNIIKDLGIARGTFYKYFDDLNELYVYFYQELHLDLHQDMIEAIKSAEGDFFEGLTIFFKQIVERFYDPAYQNYFKMIFLHNDYLTTVKLTESAVKQHTNQTKSENKKIGEQLSAIINTSLLNFEDKSAFQSGIRLTTAALHQLISDAFIHNWSKEKILAEFQIQKKLLQHGFAKK